MFFFTGCTSKDCLIYTQRRALFPAITFLSKTVTFPETSPFLIRSQQQHTCSLHFSHNTDFIPPSWHGWVGGTFYFVILQEFYVFNRYLIFFRISLHHYCSLPWGRIQEIKRMLLVHLTHGLFLTWTQKSHYIHSSYFTTFTCHILSYPTQPLTFHNIPYFTYLENQLLFSCWRIPIHPCLWSANNCPTPCFAPLTLSQPTVYITNYIIYIDDISNLGHLRLGQLPSEQ
jgi:hypothetical protein